MARARSALWLAIPMALAAGAVAWLLLSGPGSRPGEEPLGGADARGGGSPEEASGPEGVRLAKGDPKRAKGARAPEGAGPAAPAVFQRSEGVFGRVVDSHEAPVAGARVSLWASDPTQPWGLPDPPPLATASAAPDGTYLVGPAP